MFNVKLQCKYLICDIELRVAVLTSEVHPGWQTWSNCAESCEEICLQSQAANLKGFHASVNPRLEEGITDFMDIIPDFIDGIPGFTDKFHTF